MDWSEMVILATRYAVMGIVIPAVVSYVASRLYWKMWSAATADRERREREYQQRMDEFNNKLRLGLQSDMFVPVGITVLYPAVGAHELPPDWLPCDGGEIRRDYNPKLFHLLGEHYGRGDGETTFNLPNRPNMIIKAPPQPRLRAEITEVYHTYKGRENTFIPSDGDNPGEIKITQYG